MTIPQVNAGATDRNRKQTKWLVEHYGWEYHYNEPSKVHPPTTLPAYACRGEIGVDFQDARLPNGSLAPDQVWELLKTEGVEWQQEMTAGQTMTVHPSVAGWWLYTYNRSNRRCLVEVYDPHNLTAAMDALIKVLETKGKKG